MREFIDGFEHGDLTLWPSRSGGSVVSTSGLDMTGSYCLSLSGAYDNVKKPITTANEKYFAFRWRTWEGSGNSVMFQVYGNNGAVFHCGLQGNVVSGKLAAYGSGPALLAETSAVININTSYTIEAYIKIDNSSGRFAVKLNGVTVIDFTGDTQNGSYTMMDLFVLGVYSGMPFGFSRSYFDNVIIDDSAWPGKSQVAGLLPNGAGYSTQWSPSAGDNYACVDEVPPSDSDFIYTNTVGNVDTYALTDLPGAAAAVKCVQVQARAQKEGSSTPQNLNLAVRTTGGNYFSADKVLSTSFVSLSHIWETNPGTAAAWTVNEVNAMEAGVKAVA